MIKYQPADPQIYPRFTGIKTFMRLPHIRETEGVDFAIVGVPWDGGSSLYTSQRLGPEAIRSASVVLRPYNRAFGVDIFEHLSGIDYGDTRAVPGYIEDTYKNIEEDVQPLFDAGVVPIFLGGDHSVTLPELRAAARKYGPVALIHFDAHTDTYDEYFGRPFNHGTPFKRAIDEGLLDVEHSIQVGMRGSMYSPDDYNTSRDLGLEIVPADGVRELGIPETIKRIRDRVDQAKVFVTLDIDFIDPAYAPGTGTREVGGFTTWETMSFIHGLAGINMIGADVVEVMPELDPAGTTALAGANVAWELISLLAHKKKQNSGQ